ncbi:MAG: hypothetical protein SNJ78_07675 [Spirochaetales bacterium]
MVAKHQILAAIEFYKYKEEANILNFMKEAVELCRIIDREYIRVLSDSYH